MTFTKNKKGGSGMIGILCDSATDVPDGIAKSGHVEVVPVRVVIDSQTFRDNEIKREELLRLMENGTIPKTSIPAYSDVEKGFFRLMSKGINEIICINIAGSQSGTLNLFRMTAESFQKTFSHLKIKIVDSRSVSIGSALLIFKAFKLIESGNNIDKIVSTLKEYVEKKIKVLFTLPTLKFLKAGGRIGKISATIAELLNIKPVIGLEKDGTFYSAAKVRGMNRAIKKMAELTQEFINERDVEALAIYRSSDDEGTLNLAKMLLHEFKNVKIEKLFTGIISPALLVHGGRGLVGISTMVR